MATSITPIKAQTQAPVRPFSETGRITAEHLLFIDKRIGRKKALEIAKLLNEIAPKYGILDKKKPLRICAFIANCTVESQHFTKKSENLRYSENAILSTFSAFRNKDGTFKTIKKDCLEDVNRKKGEEVEIIKYLKRETECQKEVFNIAYGADGYNYTGRGYIQLTLKDNYKAYAKFKEPNEYKRLTQSDKTKKEFEAFLLKIASNISTDTTGKAAMDVSCWFFSKCRKNILPLADAGNFKAVVKLVNTAMKGYNERLRYYNRAKLMFIPVKSAAPSLLHAESVPEPLFR